MTDTQFTTPAHIPVRKAVDDAIPIFSKTARICFHRCPSVPGVAQAQPHQSGLDASLLELLLGRFATPGSHRA